MLAVLAAARWLMNVLTCCWMVIVYMNSLRAADLVSTAVFLSACLQRGKPLRSLRRWGCNISQTKVNCCCRLIEYEFLALISEGCSVQTSPVLRPCLFLWGDKSSFCAHRIWINSLNLLVTCFITGKRERESSQTDQNLPESMVWNTQELSFCRGLLQHTAAPTLNLPSNFRDRCVEIERLGTY